MPLLLQRQDMIHAPRDFGEPVAVSAADFGCSPAAVAHVIEGRQHGRPVAVALAELDVEPGARPLLVTERAAVFFDVNLENSLAENANPLLGPAVVDDVADVEIGPHPRALEFINVAGEFD